MRAETDLCLSFEDSGDAEEPEKENDEGGGWNVCFKAAFQVAGDDAAANKEKDQEKAPAELHQCIATASAAGSGCIVRRRAMASPSSTIRETRSHRDSHPTVRIHF